MDKLSAIHPDLVTYIVWGAISGLEDKPYMKRPEDRSIRMPVGSWFAGVFQR